MEKLEAALAEATQLAKRYRRLYLDEKSARRAARAPSPELDSDRSRDTDSSRLTEEDLEDDEALFKRHVARLADTKSMLATTPIRVQDVIRKNEVCPLKSVMMPLCRYWWHQRLLLYEPLVLIPAQSWHVMICLGEYKVLSHQIAISLTVYMRPAHDGLIYTIRNGYSGTARWSGKGASLY